MAHNFRTALGGFHKEDVVRYLEYINAKHQNQINQLNAEIEELRSQPAVASAPEDDGRIQSLEAENQALLDRNAALEQRCAELEALLEEAKNAPEAPAVSNDALELEAYRKAEQIQKDARDRAELVYFQTNTVLSDATARIEGAAGDITALTDQVMGQITQLQVAVSASKQALQEAAAVMGTIRPNR